MVKEIQGTIYQCELSNNENWWEFCNPEKPFISTSKKKTEEHQMTHQSVIDNWNKEKHLREISEEVLEREIRIGKWADWKNILILAKKINLLTNRQGVFTGQSMATFCGGIGVAIKVKELIWLQTKEGKTDEKGYKQYKDARNVLEAIFNERLNREKKAKNATEHLPELRKATEDLQRELLKNTKKFKDIEGMKGTMDSVMTLLNLIKMDVESLAKQGVKVVLD